MCEGEYFVLTQSLRGRYVKELGIFPSVDSARDFSTPAPVCHFLVDDTLEQGDDDFASERLWLS